MVDKDLKLVSAIKNAYADVEVAVLLCWFHVLQVCVSHFDLRHYENSFKSLEFKSQIQAICKMVTFWVHATYSSSEFDV